MLMGFEKGVCYKIDTIYGGTYRGTFEKTERIKNSASNEIFIDVYQFNRHAKIPIWKKKFNKITILSNIIKECRIYYGI